MKLLLDEQIPARLARAFPERFEVRTVQQMGWTASKNGVLLRLAANDGFSALLSADKNMEHQQDPAVLALPVIVLAGRDNRLPALEPLIPRVLELLDSDLANGFHRVDA